MEWARSSTAALLFLTLVALAAASASSGGGDDAAAAAAVEEQQCRPLAHEPYMPQLGAALANTMAAAAAADDDEQAGYMLFGMQTGGGDKIRLVVVADQSHFFVTGFIRPGFSNRPGWSFRDGAGDRHRLVPLGSSSRSHAEVVASNVLRALMDARRQESS